jgi:hypothetical protein
MVDGQYASPRKEKEYDRRHNKRGMERMNRRSMMGLGLAATAFSQKPLAYALMPGDGSVPADHG